MIAVGHERLAELTAADDAIDGPDGEIVGADEWDALRRAVVAEGIRRCVTIPK